VWSKRPTATNREERDRLRAAQGLEALNHTALAQAMRNAGLP